MTRLAEPGSRPIRARTEAGGGSARTSPASAQVVAGVALSHPERVLYPHQGATKLDLARFYEGIADWILPHLRRRPLTLVRCPQGRARQCFYQKHPGDAMAADIPRIRIREKSGSADYLYVDELPHVVSLVQAGVLELHVWGSRVGDLERPDTAVFDLDPGDGVPWGTVLETAKSLRARLEHLGLHGFPRTTGGNGLHVVVPLEPRVDWETLKNFTRAVCRAHAADDPQRHTTNMSKAKRRGRIFLDYLRNGRGATAIASYSTRAREGAPVAVPVRWDELNAAMVSNRYNLDNLPRRLRALRGDPWQDFQDARRPITRQMRQALESRAP